MNQTARRARGSQRAHKIDRAARETLRAGIRSGAPQALDNDASCFARKRVAGVPRSASVEREQESDATSELVRIPSTPIGIVDTMRVRLDRRVLKADVSALLHEGGWMKKGGIVRMLIRKDDGLRVQMLKNMVLVEVSVPRLLGLASDQQHEVTVEDLLRAFDMMTAELLPRTTAAASKKGILWHVVRLDLAINFEGTIGAMTEVVRKQNVRPQIQGGATTFDDRGVAFLGSNHALVIYRTDKRPTRGKLTRALDGKTFANKDPKRLRVEFRYQTPKAIDRLVAGMKEAKVGLPFKVTTASGKREIRTFAIDYQLLHQKLATVAARLSASNFDLTGGCGRGSAGFAIEALARFGDQHPELWEILPRYLQERSVRSIKKSVGQVQVGLNNVNLLDLCWNRPRISAELRKLLIAQAEADAIPLVHEIDGQ